MSRTSNKRSRPASRTCIGKVRHSSFRSAKNAVKQQHDRSLRPYQCDVCNGVHLTTAKGGAA